MRPASSPAPGQLRAFVASLSGTSLEWYDFALYNVAAALLFGQLFFPEGDPGSGTLKAFGTYAAGYLSRPLGGLVFGRMGDLIGRKKVLVATLLLVGASTFCIGLLPTYAEIGVVAPVLLVIFRFAQGIGVGGEWGGAVLLSSEFSNQEGRGFWASAAQLGPPIGTLLANAVVALLIAILPEGDFIAWGWRLAFLLSGVLVVFGLWIRVRIEEPPLFVELAERGERAVAPVSEVLRTRKRALAGGILSRIGPDIVYALFTVFVLSYAVEWLHLSRRAATSAVLAGSALQILAIPLSAWASDRFGRRLVYAVGAVGAAIWSALFFLTTRDATTLALGVIVGLIFHAMMYGPQAALIAEQFETRLRYTGSSLAYTLAGPLGGAIAPVAFSLLLMWSGTPYAIALYTGAACLVTLFGLSLCAAGSSRAGGRDQAAAGSEQAGLREDTQLPRSSTLGGAGRR